MTRVLHDDLPKTIPQAFDATCRQAFDRIAMQIKQGDGYRKYTYEQVAQQVHCLANALIRQGLRPGDRVAIVTENRPEWVIAYLGILAAGGTAVPLDIQLSSRDLGALLARSGSRMVFASSRTWSLIQDLPSRPMAVGLDPVGDPDVVGFDQLVSQQGIEPVDHVKVDPDDVASLLYTSGTTGEPKGVLLTHRNFVSNAQALTMSGLAGSDDNFLVILPLHHTYPFMTACLVPLMLGAKMTFLQSLKGPDLIQCLQETQITMLVGVPQVFAMVRRAIFDQLSRRPRPIRVIFTSL